MQEIKSLAEELTGEYGPYRVAVAVGQDIMSLGGLELGRERGLVEPILVGHRRRIQESLEQLNLPRQGWKIIEEKDQQCRQVTRQPAERQR